MAIQKSSTDHHGKTKCMFLFLKYYWRQDHQKHCLILEDRMPSQRRKFKWQLKHFPTFTSKTFLSVWLSWLLSSCCTFCNVAISVLWIGLQLSQYFNNLIMFCMFFYVIFLWFFIVFYAYVKWPLELYLSHWRQIYPGSCWRRVWKAFYHWLLAHTFSVNFQFYRQKLRNIIKKSKNPRWNLHMKTRYVNLYFNVF